jgi:hypothetical protein
VADNTTAATGSTIATDDIGGTHYQRIKIGQGADGSYADVSSTAPLAAATPSSTVSGTITAANATPTSGSGTANSSVTLTVPDNHASWTAIIGGTFSAGTRLAFQCSIDGTTWYYTNGRRNLDSLGSNEVLSVASTDVYGAAAPTGGNPSLWKGTSGGVRYIRITCITYTAADSVTVRIDSSAGVGGTFQLGPLPAGSAVAMADGAKTTYSATLNNTAVAGVVTASVPVWEIQNPTANTTKLIRVTRIEYQLVAATAGVANLMLVKRAVSTAGTAVAQAASTGHDSTNATATAVVNYYTAAPTAGTTVANIRHHRLWAHATTLTATTSPPVYEWHFGNRPGQSIILRPGQALSLQSSTAFTGVPTLTGSVEWTEELI